MSDNINPSPAHGARRYQLADLTMAAGVPWFAVHVSDESGHTSSWIIRGNWAVSIYACNHRFGFQMPSRPSSVIATAKSGRSLAKMS